MSIINALNKKITFEMFFETMKDRFKNILGEKMTDEEKLEKILEAMARKVQEKRVLTRQIGREKNTNKKFMDDLKEQREKLIKLGGRYVNDPARAGQIHQDVKMVNVQIHSLEITCKNGSESYDTAYNNYKEAVNALETAKRNAPVMIKAIKAHRDELARRDTEKTTEDIDISFLKDLADELDSVKEELRSDKEIDDDLDSSNSFVISEELAKMDAEAIDESIMAEFRAAAEKK